MKQEVSPRPQSEIDKSFAQIIEEEFGADTARQAIGEAAIRQTLPFGEQFMRELPHLFPDPKATTPGGRTVSELKIDDVLEVDAF